MKALRRLLHRYVPAHFHDPVGLAWRLVRSGDPAAWFAMAAAAAGAACTPLDMALAPAEQRLLRRATTPRFPLLFVCGAPRSGTTLVYQTLVNHLPMAYLSNVAALFPRAPLTAHRLCTRFAGRARVSYSSFYGRTHGLAGTNDALALWDRWLGVNRDAPPEHLGEAQRREMRAFFAACDATFGRPLVNKNNSLNLSAHLVADCLPRARFLCLTRDARSLARSLYRARCDIHGAPSAPYGASLCEGTAAADPVSSVCAQAAFYAQVQQAQCQRLGAERFRLVSYEEFCRDPATHVRRVAVELFGDERAVMGSIPKSFVVSGAQRVPRDVAAQIDRQLETLAGGGAAAASRLVAAG